MKKLLSTLLFSSLLFLGNTQVTITLQPDNVQGKDAMVWFLTTQTGPNGATNDNNYGSDPAFLGHEWTWNGSVGRRRSLIDFDLSSIPVDAIISDARLSLFAFPASADGGHSTLSGSNEALIKQITSTWDENTVTWNTMPTVTDVNQVSLAGSTAADQDYTNIDVTTLIQAQYLNPASYHGLLLSLVSENNYRSMIFASSDNADSSLHPKLVVTYTDFTGLSENDNEANIQLYPNPTNGNFSIFVKGEYQFEIKNLAGQTVVPQSNLSFGVQELNMASFAVGTYFVQVVADGKMCTRRLCIN